MAEPPEEMKGRGLPVVGSIPSTQPMLRKAWKTSMSVQPPAIMPPKRSGALRAIFSPEYSTAQKSPTMTRAPANPISSPMMAKMKSVSASGR